MILLHAPFMIVTHGWSWPRLAAVGRLGLIASVVPWLACIGAVGAGTQRVTGS
jgi:hypothetical protein